MKKFIIVSFAVVFAFAFSACTKEEENSPADETVNTQLTNEQADQLNDSADRFDDMGDYDEEDMMNDVTNLNNVNGDKDKGIQTYEDCESTCEVADDAIENGYEFCYNGCIHDIAIDRMDLDGCSRVIGGTSDVVRSDCIGTIALGLEDVTICENIEDSLSRDTCYISYNEEFGGIDLCEVLSQDGMIYSLQCL